MRTVDRIISAIQDAPELTVKEYATLLDMKTQSVASAAYALRKTKRVEYVGESPVRLRVCAPHEVRQERAKPKGCPFDIRLQINGKTLTIEEAKQLYMSLDMLFGAK